MHRLTAMDAGFLLAETRETPMHVGGLSLFTFPDGADEQAYLQDALSIFKSTTTYRLPFGHKLKLSALGAAGPTYWVPDERLDAEYHVRHSALPKPGRFRELFSLCSRLHQSLLDRHRPPWEVHIIEGLQKRQFALYFKIHHCAIDGVGGVRLAQTFLSEDPNERREHSPFSLEAHERARARRESQRPPPPPAASAEPSAAISQAQAPPSDLDLRAVAEVLSESFGLTTNLLKGLRRYARAWLNPGADNLMTSWSPRPQTSFSTRVTGARRFVAQSYSLDRVKAVGRALSGTINDVVLAMCGGALRRYLLSRGELPDAPLTALTPVSLRTDADDHVANAVGALTADLATHLADPEQRFRRTQASMNEGKSLLKTMSAKEILTFSQLTAVPALLIGVLGLADRFPPFSTVISNVPGPRKTTYWNGARLEGMYPISAIYHGFALNFTLLSNGNQLDFGVIACRSSVPSCQRIIDDLEASLVELEHVAGTI